MANLILFLFVFEDKSLLSTVLMMKMLCDGGIYIFHLDLSRNFCGISASSLSREHW